MTMQLRNYTEEVVKSYLEKWFKNTDICQCENCLLDVTAIMLNELPPKYVVTEQGALFAQLSDFDLQHRTDLMAAMTQAVKRVKTNPKPYCEGLHP